MDILTPPLVGQRSVHMLKEMHYGQDDPILYPQPFDSRIPHLAFIQHPSSFPEPQCLLWWLPEPSHFQPLDTTNPSTGLGHIQVEFRQILKGEFLALKTKVNKIASNQGPTNNIKSDYKISDYIARLKYLFGCLDMPATYDEAVMQWRLTQRTCLEFGARLKWLDEGRIPYYAVPSGKYRTHNVIGALTDRLDVAEGLWKCGSPVWLVRPLGADTDIHVIKWLDSVPVEELPSRSVDIHISYADAPSPHPVIFSGPAGSAERYGAMALYNHRLAFPARVYGNTRTEPSISSGPSRPLETRSSTPKEASRPTPYEKSKRRTKNPPTQDRNKFLDIESPIMPVSLPNWMKASAEMGAGFNASLPPPPGINRGYALPDPNIFAHQKDDDARASYFTTYLKLRPVLFYCLHSSHFEPLLNPVWRKMIALELHGSRTDTVAAATRRDIQASLMKCMENSNLQGNIDLSNLRQASVVWQGGTLTPFVNPPDQTCREILWELFEANFRHELLQLDRLCYDLKPVGFDDPRPDDEIEDGQILKYDDLDASNAVDREMKILACIPHFDGRRVPESPEDGRRGFASRDLIERQQALWGLFRVMRGWTKAGGGKLSMTVSMSPGTEKAGWTLEASNILDAEALDDAEYRLARFYVHVYMEEFGRAPLLPHSL